MIEPSIPPGFEAFWQETVEEAFSVSLNYQRAPQDEVKLDGFLIDTFSFFGMNDEERFGWIAAPCEHPVSPAFLWVPPYGRESLLPDAYGTRSGFVSASLNFFGHGPFYREKYQLSRGYFAEGVADKRTWVMRRLFQDALVALRILRDLPEVDSNQVSVMGMSQGGGIAIWLGAWINWVKAVCSDMPFLGGVSQTLGLNVHRYPLKELIDFAETAGLDRVKETIRYFDTLNVATRCSKPTHLSLGEKDPAVRPVSVEAVYSALVGPKTLVRYPVGHDWFPAMIEENRTFLLKRA